MPNLHATTAWIVRDDDGMHPESLASNRVESMNAYCMRIMEGFDPMDMAANWKRAQEDGAALVRVRVEVCE